MLWYDEYSGKAKCLWKAAWKFYTEDEMKGLGKIPMTFIRAPYIADVYGNAETLAVVDGKVVAARQENQLATAFHPELNDDTSVHEYFVQMIKESKTQ